MTNEGKPATFEDYVISLFAPEDDVLKWIQAEADHHEMPRISLRADEARLLQVFMKAINARKVVEIGTLAGYSGVWLARALPDDGRLFTLEKSSKHAQVARASFEKAGVSDKVTLLEGSALDLFKQLNAEAPFDMVFMDADRSNYVNYFNWVRGALRAGGILVVHNALANKRILTPENDDDFGMIAFQKALAEDETFDSIVITMGDGMVVAVKKSA